MPDMDVERDDFKLVAAVLDGELWSGKIAINGKNGRAILEDSILGPLISEYYVVDEREPEIRATYHGSWIGNWITGKSALLHDPLCWPAVGFVTCGWWKLARGR
ncbi:hypothetical protein E4U60_005263 [Claviceps pazoutovae]|uniref:Uncharacterized protein n=1 Tax=Claviceps pazoutovae TaxID=1649127 RepID=A0A9P7SFE8_9HYPO|nr:hypothetical protein E4U60_005263 [Claviceps pazoutovae]